MVEVTDADKQYRHSHSQHLRDEDHLRIARHVAKAVTDAELDRLVERNNRYIASLRGENELKCGNGMASFALEESTTAITALRARIAELEAFQQQAIKQVCELAREAGEAKGKLEASELPGIVDDWREKCERLERRVAELEAERAEWVEVERLRMGKPTPPTPPA